MNNQQPTTNNRQGDQRTVYLSGLALLAWAAGRPGFHFDPQASGGTDDSGGSAGGDGGGDSDAGGDKGDDKPTPRTYTEAEVQARLRGQAKELEAAKKAQAELEKLKAEKAKADEEESKRRGEYEELFKKEKAKAADLEESLKAQTAIREAYEARFTEELEQQLGSVEDKDTRKRWKGLLEGQDVLTQRKILAELMAAAGNGNGAPPVNNPGPPGKGRPPTIEELRKTKEGRVAVIAQRLGK